MNGAGVMSSAIIRTFLANLARVEQVPSSAPRIVVATPAGHLHELGALLVAENLLHVHHGVPVEARDDLACEMDRLADHARRMGLSQGQSRFAGSVR